MATEDTIVPLSQMPNPTGRLYSHYDEDGKVSYSTEPPHAQQTSDEKKPEIKQKRRSWLKAQHIFSFLLIVGALGLSYYIFNQMAQIEEQVTSQPPVAILSSGQHDVANQTEKVEKSTPPIQNDLPLNNAQFQDLTTKQQDLTQKLSETQQTVENSLSSIKTDLQLNNTQIQGLTQKLSETQQQQQQTAETFNGLKQNLVNQQALIDLQATELKQLTVLLTQKQSEIVEINATLRQVKRTTIQTSQDWTLKEVGYLLNLAQYRLQFMLDVKTALDILSVAKNKLQQWSQPQLTQPLIAQIELDITNLQTIQNINPAAITQQFSDYIHQIAQLPLVKAATPPTQTDSQPLQMFSILDSWGDVTSVIWSEMKQLVTISHNENVDVGLLTEAQVFFIQENLRLKLETARLALLKSDYVNFKAILNEATTWLKQYYDQNSMQVVEIQIALQQLQKQDFSTTYPDMATASNILQRINIQWTEHFAH